MLLRGKKSRLGKVSAPGWGKSTVAKEKQLQVVVRDAGHMVPGDQPARALDMIERFIQGRPPQLIMNYSYN